MRPGRFTRKAAMAAGLLLLAISARASGGEKPPELTWQVICPDRPEFSAALFAGEAMWSPPSERLWITRRLDGKPDATGTLKPEAAFLAAGGADGGRHGEAFVMRAPSRAGAYVLRWNGEKAFDLLVLTAAKMRCLKTPAGQRLTVTLGRRSVGVYGDPTAAESERVRLAADRYLPPLWFFHFDAKTETVHLSKHLQVGDMVGFIGRGPAEKRKGRRHVSYFPPRRALVRKLEAIIEILEKKGIPAGEGLVITSGFRTPGHNSKAGGSGFSRHVYGDAADVIIDAAPRDGRMDDLNRDSRIDAADGLIVANAARDAEYSGKAIPGGIGLYEYTDPKSVGCHVHIDARGYPTRWGTTWRSGRPRKLKWWPEWEFPEEEEDE